MTDQQQPQPQSELIVNKRRIGRTIALTFLGILLLLVVGDVGLIQVL